MQENLYQKDVKRKAHYNFSRSKYFHLLKAPIEGFITLIG